MHFILELYSCRNKSQNLFTLKKPQQIHNVIVKFFFRLWEGLIIIDARSCGNDQWFWRRNKNVLPDIRIYRRAVLWREWLADIPIQIFEQSKEVFEEYLTWSKRAVIYSFGVNQISSFKKTSYLKEVFEAQRFLSHTLEFEKISFIELATDLKSSSVVLWDHQRLYNSKEL